MLCLSSMPVLWWHSSCGPHWRALFGGFRSSQILGGGGCHRSLPCPSLSTPCLQSSISELKKPPCSPWSAGARTMAPHMVSGDRPPTQLLYCSGTNRAKQGSGRLPEPGTSCDAASSPSNQVSICKNGPVTFCRCLAPSGALSPAGLPAGDSSTLSEHCQGFVHTVASHSCKIQFEAQRTRAVSLGFSDTQDV